MSPESAPTRFTLEFDFPLPRPLTGVTLGNGRQGLLVWGDERLCVTVARAGFWDHRGGGQIAPDLTFARLRAWLEAGDESAIRDAFAGPTRPEGCPPQPYQIGGGRLELEFPDGLRPERAVIDLRSGRLMVTLGNDSGRSEFLTIHQSVTDEVAWIALPEALAGRVAVRQSPAWRFVGERLTSWGVAPAEVEEWAGEGRLDRGGTGEGQPGVGETDETRAAQGRVYATGGTMLQRLPQDAALAIAWRRSGLSIVLANALGADPAEDPRPRAVECLDTDPAAAVRDAERWWARFWDDVPDLDLPDPVLMRRYRHGLWCLAGCTMAEGEEAVAAGLQGPFMEDSKLPDWSNDFHCNINVQMMYWPLLACNRPGHFDPLWRMIRRWLPLLRERGRTFFGAEGALMLPHATDDRCQVVGNFWTGTIDHACCAWMAQLAWLCWRYSGDDALLREVAWPLLIGAFEGYWAMAERLEDVAQLPSAVKPLPPVAQSPSAVKPSPPVAQSPSAVKPSETGGEVMAGFTAGAGCATRSESSLGERLSLPVSVSPEYYASSMKACGRDATFQLGAFRCVAQILPQAAAALGQATDPRWAEALALLPHYTTVPVEERWDGTSGPPLRVLEGTAQSERRIALWEGLDLEESHRHHGHLAVVYPFATVDPADPAHADAVRATYGWWTLQGAGFWAGWSLAWASILCARMNRAQAAVAYLHWMDLAFTNEGGLTTHSGARGATVMCFGSAEIARDAQRAGRADCEVIQMDAALGAVTAVTELLVQCRPGGVIAVLPDLPVAWRAARFDRIGCEGGFRVGATVARGRCVEVRVTSLRGERLRLAHGLGERFLLNGQPAEGALLDMATRPGQQLVLRRELVFRPELAVV